MGVQAAIAFLNGNDTDPNIPSTPGKRLYMPKSATSNWSAQRMTGDKKKDNTSTSTNNNTTTTPSKATTTPSKATTTPSKASTTPSKATTTLTSSKRTQKSRTTIDMLFEQLTAHYQEELDKNDSSKEIIAKLESDVELYACDSTKVRDYEIRVEYLAQKLEQVSEERDQLEQELSTYKDRHGSLVTPVSPAFGPDVFGDGKPTMMEAAPTTILQNQQHNENDDTIEKQQQHQQQQQELEDIYFDEILDAYEERRSMDNDDMMIQQQEHNEQMVAQMLAEYDQGMKMAMEVYVADLEKQRLENKTLQSMVKKQDELIKKLEIQCGDTHSNDNDHLSDNIITTTTTTIKEDQQLLQQQHYQRMSPSARSSIDVLAELAQNDSIPVGSTLGPIHQHHHQRDTGRNTPPPFAPPKSPLPSLPAGDHSNSSINNDSLISYSRSSTSSTTWSSDDQHHHQHQQHQHLQQHPLSSMTTGLPPKHNSIEDHHHHHEGGGTFVTGTNPSATSGSFWNGLKKKF